MDINDSETWGKEDTTIKCSQCGKDFPWSISGQLYFKEKQFNPPKRCRDCRAQRKAQHPVPFHDPQ